MRSPLLSPAHDMVCSPATMHRDRISHVVPADKDESQEDVKPITLKSELMQILNFAWPVTIATIARMAMYNIDTAFLGHLGTAELAGSAMASLVANLVSTFLYAPCYGLNSLCSQAIGAGNPTLAGNWLQLALGASTVMLIPSFLLLFFVKPLISPFEPDVQVQHFAELFGRYSTTFLIPTFVYMGIRQYFQALQIVHPATVVSIVSLAMNVALNQLLIHGVDMHLFHDKIHIQFNGLGFIGSPLATTCSLFFQLTLFCLYALVYKRYPQKSGAWSGFTMRSFSPSRIKSFFKVILPMMIGDATENWSYQVVVMATGSLPDTNVAANTVIFSMWSILWAIFWGVGLATIVRTGKAISNGDVHGVKLIIGISAALSVLVNGLVSAVFYIFRLEIAGIYTASDDVIEILDHCIPILAVLFFVGGLGWTACGVLEGMARNTERSVVYSVSAWLIFVPGAIYLAIYSKWSHAHKWSAISLIWKLALAVEVIRCALIWVILLRTDWEKQVLLAKQRSEAMQAETDPANVDEGQRDDLEIEHKQKKRVRTSPKTRALIQNYKDDDDNIKSEDDSRKDSRALTAYSLHSMDSEVDHSQNDVLLEKQGQAHGCKSNEYFRLN